MTWNLTTNIERSGPSLPDGLQLLAVLSLLRAIFSTFLMRVRNLVLTGGRLHRNNKLPIRYCNTKCTGSTTFLDDVGLHANA